MNMPSVTPARRAAPIRLGRPPAADRRGQTLVEFALVIPLFLILSLAVVEFAFVFNAVLATNFSTRTAALLAAEAGSGVGADCVILQSVESEVGAPADRNRIVSVQIYWADTNGIQKGSNVTAYSRTGSTTCTYVDGSTVTVPYTRTVNGYAEADRCNILAGCPGGHTGLDTVGVRVQYSHLWKTPLHNFLPGSGTGFLFERSNAMRMEPIL
jgi:Flp pilus assembly protein TadG